MKGKRKVRIRITRKPLTVVGRLGKSVRFAWSADEKHSKAYRKAARRAGVPA